MRILIASNAGWVPSGYGTQIKYLAPGLKGLGHEIAVFAFHGLEGLPTEIDGILHYPKGFVKYGNDVVVAHAQAFQADILLTLFDPWALRPDLGQLTRWVSWGPVDCVPVPAQTLQAYQHAWKVIAYSKFGQEQLLKSGVDAHYIPHGVNCDVFRPMPKSVGRGLLGLPEDIFLVGMVAANQTPFPTRKSFERNMEAFAIFHDRHPDARMHIHSYAGQELGGVDLAKLAHFFEIQDIVTFPSPYQYLYGFTEDRMAQLYSAFDVLLGASMGEGFQLPVLESAACGRPAITTNFSGNVEITFSGWLVEWRERVMTGIYTYQVLPDVDSIVERLEEAYEADREAVGMRCREEALKYHWPKLLTEYWRSYLEELEAELTGRQA